MNTSNVKEQPIGKATESFLPKLEIQGLQHVAAKLAECF